jgi:plasmid stability protein
MRVHVNLDDELVRELDRRAGRRGRSTYIAATLQRALDDERRWEEIAASVGKVSDSGHEWDSDPAAWVRAQRRADQQRVG